MGSNYDPGFMVLSALSRLAVATLNIPGEIDIGLSRLVKRRAVKKSDLCSLINLPLREMNADRAFGVLMASYDPGHMVAQTRIWLRRYNSKDDGDDTRGWFIKDYLSAAMQIKEPYLKFCREYRRNQEKARVDFLSSDVVRDFVRKS